MVEVNPNKNRISFRILQMLTTCTSCIKSVPRLPVITCRIYCPWSHAEFIVGALWSGQRLKWTGRDCHISMKQSGGWINLGIISSITIASSARAHTEHCIQKQAEPTGHRDAQLSPVVIGNLDTGRSHACDSAPDALDSLVFALLAQYLSMLACRLLCFYRLTQVHHTVLLLCDRLDVIWPSWVVCSISSASFLSSCSIFFIRCTLSRLTILQIIGIHFFLANFFFSSALAVWCFFIDWHGEKSRFLSPCS